MEGENVQLLQELRSQNFDCIRFASYRTACKLRFLQKKLNLNLIDIWNVIEAFRDHSLHAMDIQSELNVARFEPLVSSLYQNLNKRLPPSQAIQAELSSSLLLNWLLSSYSSEGLGRIRVFSIKVALATMCAGKLVDKLRYIFSQICDDNGHMVISKFSLYLKHVLALPASVYESPSFLYKEELAVQVFGGNGKVTVNDFLETLMSDPGPPVLVWLPLLHRLASVENVVQRLQCDCCLRQDFTGFRYRCVKCSSYNMCQECFWLGRSSGNHSPDHEVREYSAYKSPSKQIGHSLRKSFKCIPDKQNKTQPGLNSVGGFLPPDKTVNLSHIVPASPLLQSASHNYNTMNSTTSSFRGSAGEYSLDRILSRSPGKLQLKIDDEHKLIARYAARLAQEVQQSGRTPTDSASTFNLDTSRAQRELILQLEAKNREIIREITRLRRQQECVGFEENPALMSELRALRQRKNELENHLSTLQDSRRHLMLQLEGLMKLLKNHQNSPKSTPNTSPRSCKSPPPPPPPPPSALLVNSSGIMRDCPPSPCYSRSAPPTPNSSHGSTNGGLNMRQPLCTAELLQAADSVTNAMSSLVSQLNSESDPEVTPTEEDPNERRVKIHGPRRYSESEIWFN